MLLKVTVFKSDPKRSHLGQSARCELKLFRRENCYRSRKSLRFLHQNSWKVRISGIFGDFRTGVENSDLDDIFP